MANVDAPNGFTPIRHLTGSTIRMEELAIAYETAAAIFSGDIVELLGTGYIKVSTATTTAHVGVFAGCSYTAADGTPVFSKYWPAAQATLNDGDAIGYVYTDPNIVFAAQTSGTAAFADNGKWMDLEADAGSTTTGRSSQEVNENATSINVLRQLGLVKKPDNAWGLNGEVEVQLVLHSYLPAAGVTVA